MGYEPITFCPTYGATKYVYFLPSYTIYVKLSFAFSCLCQDYRRPRFSHLSISQLSWSVDRFCITAVQRSPRNQDVMGLNPAEPFLLFVSLRRASLSLVALQYFDFPRKTLMVDEECCLGWVELNANRISKKVWVKAFGCIWLRSSIFPPFNSH